MAFHGICMAEHLRAYVLDLVDDALLLSDRTTQVYGRSMAVALLCDDDPHDLLQTAVFILPPSECLLLQAWISANYPALGKHLFGAAEAGILNIRTAQVYTAGLDLSLKLANIARRAGHPRGVRVGRPGGPQYLQ